MDANIDDFSNIVLANTTQITNMTTRCYHNPLRWHENVSLQSLQVKGTISLIVPKSNESHKNFMALCAQLEASQLQIAPKQVHSPYPHTKQNQTLKCNIDHGTMKTKTKNGIHLNFQRDLTTSSFLNQNLGAHHPNSSFT